MSLERQLVLGRWLHSLLAAEGLEPLTAALGAGNALEGPAGDGQTHFFHVLAARPGVAIATQQLREYDSRIVAFEARLARGRPGLTLKYFQYLALLYTEVLLDGLMTDPDALLRELNRFREAGQTRGFGGQVPPFEPDDIRRLAFFLATGAGKTLLLHAHLWQVQHYLEHGAHPEALVRRADGRREFEGVYLVTPNEGLSHQHLAELALSGIEARHLVLDPPGLPSIFGPIVRVVEISKLAEEPSGDGVSVALDSLGTANLVFVDEGHKGAGTEAQVWKRRQKALSADGLLFEYSATFAQAIAAAGRRARPALLAEYGKSIVLDYSYRHFYGEHFGKDFAVLNVESVREDQAHELLLGGLLLFYQQVRLFRLESAALRPYAVEAPLWVFLGSSVNAVYTKAGRRKSDVATAVEFLRRVLEDRTWTVAAIRRVLDGESGFRDPDRRTDVFAERMEHLPRDPEVLYDEVCRDVFRGRGGLEAWEIAGADGELGLRTSTPADAAHPYFAVVNIGDLAGFRRHLEDRLGLITQEDRFRSSLFDDIDMPSSPVSILIGAKKFVEGWSSWRVSTMGLLNMGRGEGPQVIQLFGRGVRLRGRNGSLRRSAARPDADPDAPPALRELETLYIVGWNADYLGAFRDMLSREELLQPVEVPVRSLFEQVSELPVPRRREDYSADDETWTLEPDPAIRIALDLSPRVKAMIGGETRSLEPGPGEIFSPAAVEGLLDLDALHAGVLEYKARRGYGNLYTHRSALVPILAQCTLRLSRDELRDPARIQEGALRVLTTYMDRFMARREREAESRHLEPGLLAVREHMPAAYTVRPASEELLRALRDLVAHPERLSITTDEPPLPRLHLDRHLWSPLLCPPRPADEDDLRISPSALQPSEAKFLRDLHDYWAAHHADEGYRECELFVLRNPPGAGVGFFRKSGFFPDFIVWIRSPGGATRVRFVEPHGMHHGGLSGNRDKIEALKELDGLNRDPNFERAALDVGGYLVTDTPREHIPGAEDATWATLEREHKLLPQSGGYVATVLASSRT